MVLGNLEMPDWNSLRERGGALMLVWLICLPSWGVLPVHSSLWRITFILACLFVFPHFGVDWDFPSNGILSQDIQVVRFFDQNLGCGGD